MATMLNLKEKLQFEINTQDSDEFKTVELRQDDGKISKHIQWFNNNQEYFIALLPNWEPKKTDFWEMIGFTFTELTIEKALNKRYIHFIRDDLHGLAVLP